MSDILKKLKVKDGVTGKFLTVDANGVMTSTTMSETTINDLDSRVTTLEGDVATISNRIQEINGETV